MNFNIGDKVKFLNSNGGGVVTKILSSTMVSVAIEEGFEIPTLNSELIKIESNSSAEKIFEVNYSIPDDIKSSNDYEFENKSPILKTNLKKQEPGVYIAFVPHEQKWLISGDLDIYLINNTQYTVIYSLLFEDENDFEGFDYDVLESETKKNITSIKRDDINNWNKGFVQILFHNNRQKKVLLPVNASFKISANRFLKESNYIENSLMREKALLVTLCKLNEVESIEIKRKEEVLKNDEVTKIKNTKNVSNDDFIEKHLINPTTAEIDLHISELVEDPYLLDKSEIIDIQINYFVRCLEEAFTKKISKLIIIHGVGNGTLKNEIIKILKTYDNIHYFDASIAKYGTGATEVYLKYQ